MAVGKGTRKCQDFISTTNIPTYTCIMYMRFCTQVGLKCCRLELGLFLQLPTGFLSISSSLKPLSPCFEHFCAQNISNSWENVGKKLGEKLGFVIWAFSSLWNQICSLKAGFTTRKISFLPLINTIPTSADSLKLFSAHLDVLASAVHILKLERYRED